MAVARLVSPFAGSSSCGSPSGVSSTIDLKGGVSIFPGGFSFEDVVQKTPFVHPSSFLVQEAPAITIPMGSDAEEKSYFLSSNNLVCHFNGFWPRFTTLHDWISNS
jgi:hypothetical protein